MKNGRKEQAPRLTAVYAFRELTIPGHFCNLIIPWLRHLQVDSARGAIRDADKKISSEVGRAESRLEQFSKDAGKTFEKDKDSTQKSVKEGIDKFDNTVEKKTSEAKSGLSSWFGFGK